MSRSAPSTPRGQGQSTETFNQLDPKYQLHPGQDPEHIFPEEYELIKILRAKRPALQRESDKFLVVFLCARRHVLDDTIELLDKFTSKRKQLGFDDHPPSLDDERLRKHLLEGMTIAPIGGFDKNERLINYIFVAKDDPKKRDINTLYMWGFWETNFMIETEPLSHLRNGHIYVINLAGAGWSNVDMSSKGREFTKALTGIFPKRMRKVLLFGGGAFLKAAFEVGKHVLSKKLIERVSFVKVEELKDTVDSNWLPREYGGELEHDTHTWIQQIIEQEAKIKQRRAMLVYSEVKIPAEGRTRSNSLEGKRLLDLKRNSLEDRRLSFDSADLKHVK